jgi:hypothetical protein
MCIGMTVLFRFPSGAHRHPALRAPNHVSYLLKLDSIHLFTPSKHLAGSLPLITSILIARSHFVQTTGPTQDQTLT